MIETIPVSESQRWDSIVNSFSSPDVYYLSGYVKAFQIHGDGIPVLFHFTHGDSRAICVMMERDVADEPLLAHAGLPRGVYRDIITPYGYGGFIFDGDTAPDAETVDTLCRELDQCLHGAGYVSAFFRFHPVFRNAHMHDGAVEVTDLGKTIALDLTSPEVIWDNIISKNRNMIRKAEKCGVEIRHGRGMELLDTFKEIYDDTMRHDNAEAYYFFGRDFYESIDCDLCDNHEIFYAVAEGKVIAMAIMIFAGSQMHYHLSGSLYEYRKMAPSNLLLYKAALWGQEQGFRTFHLGGGVGSGEDNLYRFKAAFNRNSDCRFSIGRKIIDREKYDFLTAQRPDLDSTSTFFPKYRS